MSNNLESELLDEELTDFFNDDLETKKEKQDVKKEEQEPIKEEVKEELNKEVKPLEVKPVGETKKEIKPQDKQDALKDLFDVFSVKQDFSKLKDIKDINDYKEKIEKIKNNLKSIEAIYGEETAEKIKIVLENEEELNKIIEQFLNKRDEIIKRFRTVENATVGADDNELIKRLFMRFVAMHPDVDTVFLVMAIDRMIDIRNKRLENNQANGGNKVEPHKKMMVDPNAIAVRYATKKKKDSTFTNEDMDKYLESFFNKVVLIEKHAGIKLDNEFVQFFTDPRYILSNNYELPLLMQDENYDKLKQAWSMPFLVNDSREEEMNKELNKADNQIKSMEAFYANRYGDTRDNSVIQTLKGLSNDVEEEKKRVNEDIEFFKKEKIKEKVEVAILTSIKGYTNDKKIDTLSHLLKESISSRMEYMKDEENLRRERKELINDKSNEDNEKDSKDYLEALGSVNEAVDKRREQRALGYVSFVPEAVRMSKERKAELERNNEQSRDEKAIDGEELSIGGRQKVLRYVNNYSNNNNIAA